MSGAKDMKSVAKPSLPRFCRSQICRPIFRFILAYSRATTAPWRRNWFIDRRPVFGFLIEFPGRFLPVETPKNVGARKQF
jgi:hypothetical protein